MDTKDLLWHLMQGWEATVGLEACPRLRFGVGPTLRGGQTPAHAMDAPKKQGKAPNCFSVFESSLLSIFRLITGFFSSYNGQLGSLRGAKTVFTTY